MVCNSSTGHRHGNLVRWSHLAAGSALSHRQMWQMNAQHDPRVFVIWCSLSNRFTADDSGQGRTKCFTWKVKSTFRGGISSFGSSLHPMCVFSVFVHLLVSVKAHSWFKRWIPLIYFNSVFFLIHKATVHLETVNFADVARQDLCKVRFFFSSFPSPASLASGQRGKGAVMLACLPFADNTSEVTWMTRFNAGHAAI